MPSITTLAMPLILESCIPEMEIEPAQPRSVLSPEAQTEITDVNLVQDNIKSEVKPLTFDLMGGEEFATDVEGYFMGRNEIPTFDDVDIMGEEGSLPIAYFVIDNYQDGGFETSLRDLQTSGNTFNATVKDKIAFRLGCTDGPRISNQMGDMTRDQSAAIMRSTPMDTLRIGLKFEVSDSGTDAACASLAEEISIIGKVASH